MKNKPKYEGPIDKIKFFRRRQFALGLEYFDFEGWNRYQISDEYFLTVHPCLSVYERRNAFNSITLIGYLIDPSHSDRSESQIINDMLQKLKSMYDIFTYIEGMTGRFVIIAQVGCELLLFNDAAGLRQVQYFVDRNNSLWCASQAETLAEHFGLSMDKEVLEYRSSDMFRLGKGEFWLPNNRTAYKEVQHLLPNHYLDLCSGKAVRFWPSKGCVIPVSVTEAVGLSVPILKNSIQAACNKFDLKMGISAGIDSRKTLAATKDVKDKILYFTQMHDGISLDSGDVKVPSRLLHKLGISHHILNKNSMDQGFRSYYEGNSTFARENKGNIAYTLFCHFGTECTILNSNVSEISKCLYWLPRNQINGEGLAIATGFYHPFAIKEFDQWLQGAKDACEESGLNILGLFHWEQRIGRWVSAGFGEYDIVHESFTPYNNRLLNKILLGVSERYRRNGMWDVALQQIKYMWPDVLSEPINPGQSFKERIHIFVRRKILHKCVTPWIPIYEYLRFWRRRRRMKSSPGVGWGTK